ncbi:WD40 repeat-like protein [Phlebopus sp. FC_14]|nr:WD40 repeat-like protein [Phlebopus sp. FC_14]
MDVASEIGDPVSSCHFGGGCTPLIPLPRTLPFFSKTQHWKRRRLSSVWTQRLDRVGVLGSDHHGHTGCVNALSWAQNGELLISSGDDQDIRVWRMDRSSDPTYEYPFACQSVMHTGHTENVFNAQMLPSSTRIATVAGDSQVRVFDVGEAIGRSPTGNEMSYNTREACIRVFRCHSRRSKRIITEDSPDKFLTVAEDGEVRQHDLRTSHSCTGGACPAPLVRLPHELSTIALSPLAPYEFVVGGESPFAHLFDRRHAGRYLREEWGIPPAVDDATTCVRRFSRRSRSRGEVKGYEHITGARMSAWNGHEVLLSYSAGAVYLYSTRDEPGTSGVVRSSSILPPHAKRWKRDTVPCASSSADVNADIAIEDESGDVILDHSRPLGRDIDSDEAMDDDFDDSNSDESAHDDEESEVDRPDKEVYKDAPVVYPRLRFSGHCNVKTVKDVNFLGPCDEFVTSGSDDGNFFVWKKSSGELVDVLEGDGSVVNVIEGHPNLPLLAVSGIDTTVKLFAPARGPAAFSKHSNAASIIKRNARASRRGTVNVEMQLAHFVLHYDRALQMLRNGEGEDSRSEQGVRLAQCVNQ